MTNTDFHARRTELSNTFAAAGAQLLDYMGCAGALAAIPNTQQYVVAGDIAVIRAQLDTVAPQRRMRHGDRPEQPLYFGPETGQARRWAALITGAGHGVLQEYGSRFEHALPGQEVLEVMEILPDAANKSAEEGEQVAWMIEQESDGKRIYVSCNKAQAEDWLQYDLDRKIVPLVRQVANKAEVELPEIKRYDIDSKGLPFEDADGVWVAYDDAKGLVNAALDCIGKVDGRATPPATTGASTAPVEDDLLSVMDPPRAALKVEDWDASTKRPKVVSAPASTVLTDERIMELAVEREPAGVGLFDQIKFNACQIVTFARAIEREVAAQAGQVAVPEDLKSIIQRVLERAGPMENRDATAQELLKELSK